ncbi:efflux RND transporter periplasmic adaptor subunit [Algoriphagus sp. AK58]|uniref:efflux RND transporter periplasmic adaptor subunit n=1 Tax=Algoriphagus sp. AK58 TaxID=1406877 RepID=UPI0016504DA8|nr:efflux RND transporter periplasmic adaptor subunit [Algoriphagus sp. AK58]MBC6367323.1 efflux RND transporter periplasmic adaptor subunit [Algoriphagus sp. AK58]
MKLLQKIKNLFAGCILIIPLLSSCKKVEVVELPPVQVNVVKAVQSDVPLYEEFVAQVYGKSDVDIRARVEGWVTSVNFKEGSVVKKGDLLYVIDDIEYKNRVDRQASEVTRAQTELVRAENELGRVRPLTEMNALSKKDLDNAIAQYEAAKANVAAVKSTLDNAKIELGYTRVTAPFDGIIGISNVRAGDYVSRVGGTSVLTTISSVDGVRVRFQISEREYLRIAQLSAEELAGAKKQVELILADGSIYAEKGEIDFANREIDPKTGTLTIEASFPNPTGLLRPGLFVKTRVLLKTATGAVLIPQRSVFQLQNLNQVFTVTDSSTLKATTVQAGEKVGDAWIITSGLKAGDRVAIVGTAGLTANTKVEVVEQAWTPKGN